MTDNEIIKALECCKKDDCDNCPNDFGNCYANLAGYALDLINRQKAEIERLKEHNDKLMEKVENLIYECDCARQEAVKEFADKLHDEVIIMSKTPEGDIDFNDFEVLLCKLQKETVGEKNVD